VREVSGEGEALTRLIVQHRAGFASTIAPFSAKLGVEGKGLEVPMFPKSNRAIHYSQLPPAEPDSPINVEYETFRREIGRLIAEGHEGKFVLIHGNEIIGIWDNIDDAMSEGYRRYFANRDPFIVQEIATWQPLLRTRLAG
jgi:hypothetical protein